MGDIPWEIWLIMGFSVVVILVWRAFVRRNG
jgi:hypothetical protein